MKGKKVYKNGGRGRTEEGCCFERERQRKNRGVGFLDYNERHFVLQGTGREREKRVKLNMRHK